MNMINKEKKIKQLDIVFENCEVCTLKPDMIYACIIDKIYNSMSINCFQYKDGEVYNKIYCDEFMLAINKKGLQQKGRFCDFESDEILEERLKSCDITHIDLIYEDGTNDYISLHWQDGTNEFTNRLQRNVFARINNNEYLIITVHNKELSLSEIEKIYGVSIRGY